MYDTWCVYGCITVFAARVIINKDNLTQKAYAIIYKEKYITIKNK